MRIMFKFVFCVFILIGILQAEAKPFGFYKEKDRADKFSFIVDADIKRYQHEQVYPNNTLKAEDEVLVSFINCIKVNAIDQSTCFSETGSNNSNRILYAKFMVSVEPVASIKWGNNISYQIKIITNQDKSPVYDIVSFVCESKGNCYSLDPLDKYNYTNSSTNIYPILASIFAISKYGHEVENDFDRNSYSQFQLLSADSNIHVFVDLQTVNKNDGNDVIVFNAMMRQLLECKQSACSERNAKDILLSNLGGKADQIMRPLGLLVGENVETSGYIDLDKLTALFLQWDACEIFSSVTIDSIKRGIIDCKGSELHNITALPFDANGFAKSYYDYPADVILSSLAAMNFLNEVRINKTVPYHFKSIVLEKPGFRIADGRAEKINDVAADVQVHALEVADDIPSNHPLLNSKIIFICITVFFVFIVMIFLLLKRNSTLGASN